MNKISSTTKTDHKPRHGTLASYITGFVLSLIFTLIPYYLVVNKSLHGDTLLATIIGFAVLQLVIQVVFFLHLGREKKPRWNLLFLISTIGLILVVVVASIWIMHHLHYNMMPEDVTNKIANDEGVHQLNGLQAGTCPGGSGTVHTIELKNDTASPSHINAHLCDTLIIVNKDNVTRDIEYGAHEMHETYAGEFGGDIRPQRSSVIILTELGTHKFHDHIEDKITGDFTVTP